MENIQQKLDEKKKAKEQNTIEGLGWIKEAQNGISESKDESSEDSVKQQVKVTIHNVETGMISLFKSTAFIKICMFVNERTYSLYAANLKIIL